MKDIQLTSSRSAGMRDINALFAPISRIKTLRDDAGHRGFTLIELLIVVLIIGILAAIALPQYQRAVIRSKFVQLQVFADAIVKSQNLYFLEHGTFAKDFSSLTLTIHGKLANHDRYLYAGPITCFFNTDTQIGCFYASSKAIDSLALQESPVPVWDYIFTNTLQKKQCIAFTPSNQKICQSLSIPNTTPEILDRIGKAYLLP